MNTWYGVFLLCGLFVENINAQTTVQACVCVPMNTSCYQNLTAGPGPGPGPNPTDGTGVIDIRIVNGGTGTGPVPTGPPGVTAAPPTGTLSCPAGQEPCCTPSSGCGVRYNIPVTPPVQPQTNQARYGSYPWHAGIFGTDNSPLGGGVLLDSINVLTAAHKVANRTPASIKVRLGDWNTNQDVETYKMQEVMVSRIIMHEEFKGNNLTNDVAILKLATPVVISTAQPAINTICPPTVASYDNMRCRVSGWGKDSFSGTMQFVLKEVDVPIVPTAQCESQLRTKTKLGNSFVLNTNSFICAGGEAGKDACVGDGGSPLVCNIGGKYQLVGLVAWGIQCGQAWPGVYVKVQSFWPWIQRNMV